MDSFCYDAPVGGSFGDQTLEQTFGETENWFKFAPPANRRRSRRKSSQAATEAITALANENRNEICYCYTEYFYPVMTSGRS